MQWSVPVIRHWCQINLNELSLSCYFLVLKGWPFFSQIGAAILTWINLLQWWTLSIISTHSVTHIHVGSIIIAWLCSSNVSYDRCTMYGFMFKVNWSARVWFPSSTWQLGSSKLKRIKLYTAIADYHVCHCTFNVCCFQCLKDITQTSDVELFTVCWHSDEALIIIISSSTNLLDVTPVGQRYTFWQP